MDMEVEKVGPSRPTVEGVAPQILETVVKSVRIVANAAPIHLRVHNKRPVVDDITAVYGKDIFLNPQHTLNDLLVKPFTGIVVYTSQISRFSIGAVPVDAVLDIPEGSFFETTLSTDRLLSSLQSCSAIPKVVVRFTDEGAQISGETNTGSELHLTREIQNDDESGYSMIAIYAQKDIVTTAGFRIRPSELLAKLNRASGDVTTILIHVYECVNVSKTMSAVTFKNLVDNTDESTSVVYGDGPSGDKFIVDTTQEAEKLSMQTAADDVDPNDPNAIMDNQQTSEDTFYASRIINADALKSLEVNYNRIVKGASHTKLKVGDIVVDNLPHPRSPNDMYSCSNEIPILAKIYTDALVPLGKNCDSLTFSVINNNFVNISGTIGTSGAFLSHVAPTNATNNDE